MTSSRVGWVASFRNPTSSCGNVGLTIEPLAQPTRLTVLAVPQPQSTIKLTGSVHTPAPAVPMPRTRTQ